VVKEGLYDAAGIAELLFKSAALFNARERKADLAGRLHYRMKPGQDHIYYPAAASTH
jgi:hypothetical protein